MIHLGEQDSGIHEASGRTGYGGSGGLNARILRKFHDYNDWGEGGGIVELFQWYYSNATHGYAKYYFSYGYSGHATTLTLTDSAGSGMNTPAWGTEVYIGAGDRYYKDLTLDIGAYNYIEHKVTWAGLLPVSSLTQETTNRILIAGASL